MSSQVSHSNETYTPGENQPSLWKSSSDKPKITKNDDNKTNNLTKKEWNKFMHITMGNKTNMTTHTKFFQVMQILKPKQMNC